MWTRVIGLSSNADASLSGASAASDWVRIGELPGVLKDPQGVAFVNNDLLVLPFEDEAGSTIYSVDYLNPGYAERLTADIPTLSAEPWLVIPGFFLDPDALAENPRNNSVFIVASGPRPSDASFSDGIAGSAILEIRHDIFAITNTYADLSGALGTNFLDITAASYVDNLLIIEGFANGQPMSAAINPALQPGQQGFVVDQSTLSSAPSAALAGSSFGPAIPAPTIITDPNIINARIAASPITGPDMSLDPTTRNLAYTSTALAQSDLIPGLLIDYNINKLSTDTPTQCRVALLMNNDLRNQFSNFADIRGGIGLASEAVQYFYNQTHECSPGF